MRTRAVKGLHLATLVSMVSTLGLLCSASEHPAIYEGNAVDLLISRSDLFATSTSKLEILSLQQALALALRDNPTLATHAYKVDAAKAGALQARLLSNPTLMIEVEEYDHDGAGSDSAEVGIALKQTLGTGRTRRWNGYAADARTRLMELDYEAACLDVLMHGAQRFVGVMASQQHLELAHARVVLAEKTSVAVAERVKAGKETPLQRSKADVALELARIGVLDAESQLNVSRKKLAALWGSETATFEMVVGSLDSTLKPLPSLEALRDGLYRNPDLMRWNAEQGLRAATLKSAKVAAAPALTVSVGYQHYQEDDSDALAFGIGLPLPLFNRNQGNIEAAKQTLAQLDSERYAAELQIASKLSSAYSELSSAYQRAQILQSRVIPAIQGVSDAAHEGYRQGKFGFLDMLDAQRGVFDAKEQWVDALVQYHCSWAAIQRLTGSYIELETNLEQENK
jgi:cobalt-zinc-cadmium efflux system outer membrane protein